MIRKKVLVTGSQGMLGWALAKELRHEYQFVGIDIKDADITNESQIKEEIFNIHPDVVIHAAAYTAVDNCEKNKALSHKVNAQGAENVATACKICQSKLIYISTDFVFDGKKNRPYTEKDKTNPLNNYGRTKLEGEQQVQKILQNVLIIRTSWLYGSHGRNFVDSIINKAKSQSELKVVNDQIGSPTYTKDLASGISLLLKKDALGIVNVSNSGSCSWYEFAEEILSIKKIKTKLTPIASDRLNRAAKRPSYSILDNSTFTKLTDKKLRSWKSALAEYLN